MIKTCATFDIVYENNSILVGSIYTDKFNLAKEKYHNNDGATALELTSKEIYFDKKYARYFCEDVNTLQTYRSGIKVGMHMSVLLANSNNN